MQDMTTPITKREVDDRRRAAQNRVERLRRELAEAEAALAAAQELRPVAKPRIDTLTDGAVVTLAFAGDDRVETATFRGIEGEGDDRRATFEQEWGSWDAYRYNGSWAYGSSADRLVLVGVQS